MAAMTIGELAAAGGVGIETVRFYERRGLLAPPARSAAGYRLYGPDDVARLVRIRRAKALGFTLGEIASLLDADEDGGPAGIVDAAAAKLDALDAEVARLAEVRHRLRRLVGVCEAGASADCLALDVPDEHRGEVVEEP